MDGIPRTTETEKITTSSEIRILPKVATWLVVTAGAATWPSAYEASSLKVAALCQLSMAIAHRHRIGKLAISDLDCRYR